MNQKTRNSEKPGGVEREAPPQPGVQRETPEPQQQQQQQRRAAPSKQEDGRQEPRRNPAE